MVRPTILYPYFADLEALPGVGVKTRARLVKLCGEKLIDLLFHLPRELQYRTRRDDLHNGIQTLLVEILNHRPAPRRGAPHIIEAQLLCIDPNHPNHHIAIEIAYFHAKGDFLRKSYPEGTERIISGKCEFRRHWTMQHPDYILKPDDADSLPNIEPIYSLTQGLTNRLFRQSVTDILEKLPDLPEWHQAKTCIENAYPTFLEAIYQAHKPTSAADLSSAEMRSPALLRLAADELLAQQLSLRFMRQKYRRRTGIAYPDNHDFRNKVQANLPFQLSKTQNDVIAEIRTDMQSPEPMLRLLMGEVGSGKTLVALMAMLDILESGAKCALMVPSETLARQHQSSIQTMLQKADLDIPCLLLVSSLKAASKKEIHQTLIHSDPVIVIGTHALIQDKVEFDNLGLVVIDEQHRFGVHQRMALSRKSAIPPEMLVMTATPIPRTLLMTHYGDLDTSRLIGRNPNASSIQTAIISQQAMAKLIQRIKVILDKGQRVFWVCPLREESEILDLAAAESRYQELHKIFADRCFLLHGGMESNDKVTAMENFRNAPNGALLIATTVIEVGVDIHDATVIVIEGAERFGLAQLHQLRGRVGRAKLAGSCILIHGAQLSAIAKERLEMMRNSDDGFALAEADLRLRGGGEIMGAKQSGLPTMHFANLVQDQQLLKQASDEAAYIVQHDPTLQTPRGETLRTLLYLFRRDAALTLIQAG